jgi:predicted dehydrogenase
MIKAAIIGCGKIADDHVQQIGRIRDCEIVGVCDREPLMSKQLCERFGIKNAFDEVDRLLEACCPDVVHITTPPQTHFAIARQCLGAGCHVYVEKPFTLNSEEAEDLIKFANNCGLKLTVGHDLQFTHVARRMRRLVSGGHLGGPPVHMESYYCYDLTDPVYAQALLANKRHWVRSLPGKLLQNLISHGIARIAEYLTMENPEVHAYGFVSPLLRSLQGEDVIDELRVLITDRQRTTASFVFSSQMRPQLNLFRVFGPQNGIEVDYEQERLIKLHGRRLKSYAEKFIPHLFMAKDCIESSSLNIGLFLARDFHMKSGMKYLIEAFYQCVQSGDSPPIPYREILLTSRIMDEIFEQLRGSLLPEAGEYRSALLNAPSSAA